MKDRKYIMKYFSEKEVNCPCNCGATLADDVKMNLDGIREQYGKAVYIEQGATCEHYSLSIGRKKTSQHIDRGNGARAVDIKHKTFGSKEDYIHFISCAYDASIMGLGQGIGNYDVHKNDKRLHIDWRDTEDIITWVYYGTE